MQQQIQNQFDHKNSRSVGYRLYLSDDATRIYLTYEVTVHETEISQTSSIDEASVSGQADSRVTSDNEATSSGQEDSWVTSADGLSQ